MRVLDNRGYSIGAWICIAGLVIATIVTFWVQTWAQTLFCGVFLVVALLFVLQRDRLPSLFSFLFALAALINALGWVFNFWDKVPGYDPFAHAFTTFAGALAAGFLAFYSTKMNFREHGWVFAMAVASFGLALGGLWEIFEWAMNVEQTYTTVVIDLIADTVGAIMAGLLAAWAIRTQPREQLHA